MLRVLAVLHFIVIVRGASETDKISSQGYPVETHHVTTIDNYILELIRIPHGKNQGSSSKGVVYLMHGFLGAFNSFTYLGSEYGIAFNLADAGYDVWMGNARGNRFSRRNTFLDPDKDKLAFFDFSFEEIALYDLPPAIDYVLDQTGQKKLHYIGHSQGGSVFMVLNSLTTNYHSKFASAHLLSGTGYQQNFPNLELKLLAKETDVIYTGARLSGNVELYPPEYNILLGNALVSTTVKLINSIFNILVPPEIIGGAATKQAAHYGQNIKDKKFRRYDNGRNNYIKYRSTTPPLYDLTRINVNVTFHYAPSDILQSEEDALAMAKDVPNSKFRKIPRDSFGHLDYILSKDVKTLVTDYIIESLKNSL